MYKKSPEQEHRRKKLYLKRRINYYDGTYQEYEYGHGVVTEVDEKGKEWVKKYSEYGTGRKGKGFKFMKRYGNRKIRYYKGDLKVKGRHYLKIYNAKWEWW